MKSRNRALAAALVALGSLLASGCGAQSVGSPSPQVQNPQPTPSKSNTETRKNQSNPKANTGSKGTSTGKKPSSGGGGSSPGSSVTIKVGSQQFAIAPAAVGVTGTSSTFVPLSASQKTVLLPVGWTLSTASLGGGATGIRLVNPHDASQMISEVVRPSSMNLQSFYASRAPGTASWLIQNQVIEFTLDNPNLPYPDRGIVANTSQGGSIRVDVYLPNGEKSAAQQILNSFSGISG